MLVIALLTAVLAVQGASIPRVRQDASSDTTLAWIGCVADSKIASLTSAIATNAEARESCASACLARGGSDIAYFRQNTHECFCASGDDYPDSGEVVYAEDDLGNCRDKDDASANYIHSPYALSRCYLDLDGSAAPSNSFTAPSPLTCLNSCGSASVAIRPELDQVKNLFVYECACFNQNVQGSQTTKCGFGVEAVYVKA
ncbi:uncharacterized protein L203_105560 [Cryptococcus depauperatus CBS 7841]|uniref:Uncharacterized protein n=1 Tax=Cryptococcus depauperatus CBS 7841 TaxID=1295531 RepID=A0A1E3IEX1_9TREE|nr:hypothetical protein L203_03436 [Cryptococcus depauperatus CBS 7841]